MADSTPRSVQVSFASFFLFLLYAMTNDKIGITNTNNPTITNSATSSGTSTNTNTDTDTLTNSPTNTNTNTSGRKKRETNLARNTVKDLNTSAQALISLEMKTNKERGIKKNNGHGESLMSKTDLFSRYN